MISRQAQSKVERLLDANPAVLLLGPRQVGKTTLARAVADARGGVYVDLERPSDLARVGDIEHYCALHDGRLIVLDEVHRTPNLFAPLRSIIDERRRTGRRTAQFLLLGSASVALLKQDRETLAGRVAHCELQPFNLAEVDANDALRLWSRGGFPESYLAMDDAQSLAWRLDFATTYLQRDVPELGLKLPAETLRRFWAMLAHNQAQTFNATALARALDMGVATATRYLDLLVDLLLVRRLPPWTSNLGRRLVKTPKIYVRDSGVCHALLGIETSDALLRHPVAGSSWEGFAIESIVGALPRHVAVGFYRTARGAEVDLVVERGAGNLIAIEVKRSTSPKVSKGFHVACEDLRPCRRFVVHGGTEPIALAHGVEAIPLPTMLALVERGEAFG